MQNRRREAQGNPQADLALLQERQIHYSVLSTHEQGSIASLEKRINIPPSCPQCQALLVGDGLHIAVTGKGEILGWFTNCIHCGGLIKATRSS